MIICLTLHVCIGRSEGTVRASVLAEQGHDGPAGHLEPRDVDGRQAVESPGLLLLGRAADDIAARVRRPGRHRRGLQPRLQAVHPDARESKSINANNGEHV